jgi:tetratricopeptide (TPR) repeat protein
MALADNLARSDQPSESMHEYQSALQIYEAMHSDPGNTGTNVEIATCKVGIATAERLTGEQQAAAADFQQALTLTAPSVARKDRDALHDAAKAYAGLGDIEATQAVESDFAERENHWKKAIQSYRHSLEIGKQIPLLAQYDPVGFRAVDVARSLQRAESELDKFVEASR